jgi:hypothetical protein
MRKSSSPNVAVGSVPDPHCEASSSEAATVAV